MSSLDDVQDSLDSLVLALFNSIRSHNIEDNSLVLTELTTEYHKTITQIDNLHGNKRKAKEQIEEIKYLQQEIKEIKETIGNLEDELQEMERKCENELNLLLTDEILVKSTSSNSNR